MNRQLKLTLVLFALVGLRTPAIAQWNVLPADPAPSELLTEHLRQRVDAAADRRLASLERLQTPAQIREFQRRLRAGFLTNLGEHQIAKTPLNARVVGMIHGEGYRIEKVIYESRPGFFVTANFYRPPGDGPFPAVLVPCGHTANGKAGYQRVGLILARHGIAALIYDPVGQGERHQILVRDKDGKPLPRGEFRATVEHTMTGVAPIALGQGLATYRIWDGLRSLDYLAVRSDVDATRLGCTGNSGGGLMTGYLMALDERILAAAPGCYITTKRIKMVRPGPGDAEQNVFRQISFGPDHPDLLMMRAPRPTLILAATRDFVPIEGTWEAFRQAKRIYGKLGFAERVDLVEADEKHGFTRPLREGMVRFMRRWLLGADDTVTEGELPEHSDEELRCTTEGQVLLLPGARSLADLYRERAGKLERARAGEITSSDLRRELRLPTDANVRVEIVAEIEWSGYRVKQLVIRGADGFPVPALRFEPREIKGAPVLHVDGRGKAAELGADGRVAQWLRAGRPVWTVDLRGFGETVTKSWRFAGEHFGNNAAEFFLAYQLGDSLVAQRARDVLAVVNAMGDETVEVSANGAATTAVLHAAAAYPGRFASVTLRGGPRSWREIISADASRQALEHLIHGAYQRYDLPELETLAGARRVAD